MCSSSLGSLLLISCVTQCSIELSGFEEWVIELFEKLIVKIIALEKLSKLFKWIKIISKEKVSHIIKIIQIREPLSKLLLVVIVVVIVVVIILLILGFLVILSLLRRRSLWWRIIAIFVII